MAVTMLEDSFSLTFSVEAPAYLIDLMHDKNAEIRKVCDNTLDIIAVSGTCTLLTHNVEQFEVIKVTHQESFYLIENRNTSLSLTLGCSLLS